MNLLKKKNKVFILAVITLCLVIAFNLTYIVKAAITSLTINSLPDGGFYCVLPYNNYPVEVTVNGGDDTTKVSLTYAGITQTESFTRTPGTNKWSITNGWCPGNSDRVLGYQSSSGINGWDMRTLSVTAKSSTDSVTSVPIKGFVTIMNEIDYREGDSTWYYYSPSNNSFCGVATGFSPSLHGASGTYNCLAYAVGIYNSWQWPWQDSGGYGLSPTRQQILNYMSDTSRPGNHYNYVTTTPVAWYTRVIYYSGDHFARVATYDSAGNPKAIVSKWGPYELIDSQSINPFPNTHDYDYGSPKYYIH